MRNEKPSHFSLLTSHFSLLILLNVTKQKPPNNPKKAQKQAKTLGNSE
jgi:hypothetical protein